MKSRLLTVVFLLAFLVGCATTKSVTYSILYTEVKNPVHISGIYTFDYVVHVSPNVRRVTIRYEVWDDTTWTSQKAFTDENIPSHYRKKAGTSVGVVETIETREKLKLRITSRAHSTERGSLYGVTVPKTEIIDMNEIFK